MTLRGNERRAIFHADAEREHFLEMRAGITALFQVRLHIYVLIWQGFTKSPDAFDPVERYRSGTCMR